MRGHCYDALVGLAGCDKSLPGMMMAMLRLNVPSRVHVWRLDPARQVQGHATSPWSTCSRRSASTPPANVSEPTCTSWNASPAPRPAPAAGSSPPTPWRLRLRGDRPRACPARPARRRPTRTRDRYAVESGRAVMDLIESRIRPRDIVTRKALRECRDGGRRDRRLDQCRPAPAGDGARGRHPVHLDDVVEDHAAARRTSPT